MTYMTPELSTELVSDLVTKLVAADQEYLAARHAHRQIAQDLQAVLRAGNVWAQLPLFVAGGDAVRRLSKADEHRWVIRNKIAHLAPGAVAVKLADPISDACLLFTLDEIKSVSNEDPNLIVSLRIA